MGSFNRSQPGMLELRSEQAKRHRARFLHAEPQAWGPPTAPDYLDVWTLKLYGAHGNSVKLYYLS